MRICEPITNLQAVLSCAVGLLLFACGNTPRNSPEAYFVIAPLIPRRGLKSKYSFRVLDAEAGNIVLCDDYAYEGNLTEYRVNLNALPPISSRK